MTRPANTVGGDFYDVLVRPDGRLVLALGDVAGKGSPAALLMALLLAMLRTLVDEGLETATLVARLNVQVHRHSPRSRFITLFFGLYDPRDGRLEFVNAGHLPPLLRRRDGRFERIGAEGGGLALGMFDHATYATQQATVEPGDLLVLYSDGITEAENAAGRSFEDTGLEQVVQAHAGEDPQAIGRAILTAVEKYAAHARLQDDLTALVLKRARGRRQVIEVRGQTVRSNQRRSESLVRCQRAVRGPWTSRRGPRTPGLPAGPQVRPGPHDLPLRCL